MDSDMNRTAINEGSYREAQAARLDEIAFGLGVISNQRRISPFEYFKQNNDFTFKVRKLTNGYTVSGMGWEATYFPDIDAILRYVAESLGGPDAVPIMPVSPEEAGLMFDRPLDLQTDTNTLVNCIHDAIDCLKSTMTPGFSPSRIANEVDKVFKGVGFDDLIDFVTGPVQPVDVLERILDALQMRIRERTVQL